MKKTLLNSLLGFIGCTAFGLLCGFNLEGLTAAQAILTVAGLCAVVAGCVLAARHTAPELFDTDERV